MTTTDTVRVVDVDGPAEWPLLERDRHLGDGFGGCWCIKVLFREPLPDIVAVLVTYLVHGKNDIESE